MTATARRKHGRLCHPTFLRTEVALLGCGFPALRALQRYLKTNTNKLVVMTNRIVRAVRAEGRIIAGRIR